MAVLVVSELMLEGTVTGNGGVEHDHGQLCDGDRERDVKDDAHPPRQQRRKDEPHEPPGPEPREADRDRVDDADAMADDPVLDVSIEPDQTGTSCFARSISCWGSNGLPTKPRAPRCSASIAERSST